MAKCINCGEEASEDNAKTSLFPGVNWEYHLANEKYACNWPNTKYNEDGRLICAEVDYNG